MKIALVSQGYPPETAGGGIGSQTFIKAKGLSALGHEVFVISRRDTRGYRTKEGQVNVIRVPGLEDYFYEENDINQWKKHSIVIAAEIKDLQERVGIDLIDFPDWGAEGYTYLLNRSQSDKIPTVIQLHGPLVMLAHTIGYPEIGSEFYRIGTQMEATCVRLADAVYSSSECSAQWIRKFYDPQKENIPTIHLGVDTSKFAPQTVPKNERPTIIFVGKIVKNKGVEELVEAAGNLVRDFPYLRLRLIGRGQEAVVESLKEKADKLGASELMDFAGFVDRDHLPEELSRAHVFAAPSYYEGGPGFVFLEAMSCGLPVVGCRGSGVEEIVTSGKTGLLVPPRDSKVLEEALRKILSDKKLLEVMGANAREYVLKEADSQVCLKKLESFYDSVVDSR